MNIRKSIEAAGRRGPANREEAEAKTIASLMRKLKRKHKGIKAIEDRECFDIVVMNASKVPISLRVGGGSHVAATVQTLGDLTYWQAEQVGTMLGIKPPTYLRESAHQYACFAVFALHGDTSSYVVRISDLWDDPTALRGAWLIAIARATGGAS